MSVPKNNGSGLVHETNPLQMNVRTTITVAYLYYLRGIRCPMVNFQRRCCIRFTPVCSVCCRLVEYQFECFVSAIALFLDTVGIAVCMFVSDCSYSELSSLPAWRVRVAPLFRMP